ncbi:Hypothetical predicted protein [Paramuricea clavata]|uniref:Uncharacterized protein n=1 Tax=Paramuricea clavata TaxID=317549 RepID=A0A7D9HAQ0_PARCT|nr:Hypothetical predicted protein [Paramuricea clavata]
MSFVGQRVTAVEIFAKLLTNYPYHPYLWVLHSVCKHLHKYRPLFHNQKVIKNISEETSWLGGSMHFIRDFLALDDTKPDCWYALTTKHCDDESGTAKVYLIPPEWVKRIVIINGEFTLMNYEFCCRQVLKHTDCKIVRCKSHSIKQCYHLDKYYFHVGWGPCFSRVDHVFVKLNVFVGLRQLSLMLEENKFSEPAQMIYALGQYDFIPYQQLDKETDKIVDVMYSGRYLKNILSHILVCRKCNKGLLLFLRLLDECIVRVQPYPDHKSDTEVDAEFDMLLFNAFNAPKDGSVSNIDICNDIVNGFFDKNV